MKKAAVLITVMIILLLCRCGAGYKEISQDEAMQIMQEQSGYIILDVRRADEFAEGHIPGAVNVPNETIQDEGQDIRAFLPDTDQMILVYCRTGNRSKKASRRLADLGYTNVYEFGGISTWEGEVVRE